MKDVPDTGSIPVSPMTRTAIAPSKNVVKINTVAKTMAAAIGNPPIQKMMIIAINEKPMNSGIWCKGHSYQPLPSMYSCPFSPPNALAMSPKIDTNVGAILSRPSKPPPRMAPIAIVRMSVLYAIHCTGPPISCSGVY